MKMAGLPDRQVHRQPRVKIVGSNTATRPEQIGDRQQRRHERSASRPTVTCVDQSVMYGKYCGVPKAEIDACPNVGLDPRLRRSADDALRAVRRSRHRPDQQLQLGARSTTPDDQAAADAVDQAEGGRSPSAPRRARRRGRTSTRCSSTRPSRSRGSSTTSRTSSPRQRPRHQRPLEHRDVGLHLHVAAVTVSVDSLMRAAPGRRSRRPASPAAERIDAGYIVRRLSGASLLLVAGRSLITFVIFYLLPNVNPAVLRAGKNADPADDRGDQPQSSGLEQADLRAVLALPEGASSSTSTSATATTTAAPVSSLILDRLPATISLTVGAAVLWMVVGVPIGIISAIKRRTFLDRAAMGGALVFVSAPVLLARADRCCSCSPTTSVASTIFLRRRQLRRADRRTRSNWFESLILPWIVLAGHPARDLRAAAARQPAAR